MRLKAVVKSGLEKLIGARIFGTLPHGLDIFSDIRVSLPKLDVRTVFDVGANIGQSALHYVEAFPRAKVYCFEPVLETFNELRSNVSAHVQVSTFRMALADSAGTGRMILAGGSDLASLGGTSDNADATNGEEVGVETLDTFCRSGDIAHINYLKIDTEGGDLAVLKGASQMLTEQRIDIIELEAGMNRRNTHHVPFGAFDSFLGDRNYFLFGIYEQVLEWPSSSPNLRRSNPVFVSERVVKANTGGQL